MEIAIRMAQAAALAPEPDPVPEREQAKPLERAPEPEPEVPPPTRPYTVARLDIGGLWEPLHEVSPGRLADWIAKVVEVESPVHLDEVTVRIRTAVGVGRAGSRIRAQMRLGARTGVSRGFYTLDADGFLRWPGRETTEARRRNGNLPPSLRDPWRIAPEEVGVALIHAVRVSYGIAPEDAVREAVRLFGFKQAGRRIVERFRQVLDRLVGTATSCGRGRCCRWGRGSMARMIPSTRAKLLRHDFIFFLQFLIVRR